MENTDALPPSPRPQFRQQFPRWAFDAHIRAVAETLEIIQKNLSDGEYQQIDTRGEAQKFQRRVETVRIELCRILAEV